MLVEWNSLAPESKVWVFAHAEPITQQQKIVLKRGLETFIENWLSHQEDLKAAYQIIDDYFVVLAAETPSGCSTDNLFRTMKTLSQDCGLNPLPNSYIVYRDQNNQIKSIDFPNLKAAVQTKKLLPQDLIFDNTVSDLVSFEESWQQKAETSWLKRYF